MLRMDQRIPFFLFNVDGKMVMARVPVGWMPKSGDNTFVLNFAE